MLPSGTEPPRRSVAEPRDPLESDSEGSVNVRQSIQYVVVATVVVVATSAVVSAHADLAGRR